MKRMWMVCAVCLPLMAAAAWGKTELHAPSRAKLAATHGKMLRRHTSDGARFLFGDRTAEPGSSQVPGVGAFAFRYVSHTSGTARTASVYVRSSSSSARLRLLVYADSENSIGRQLAAADVTGLRNNAWNTVDLPATHVGADRTYWIDVVLQDGSATIPYRKSSACFAISRTRADQATEVMSKVATASGSCRG